MSPPTPPSGKGKTAPLPTYCQLSLFLFTEHNFVTRCEVEEGLLPMPEGPDWTYDWSMMIWRCDPRLCRPA